MRGFLAVVLAACGTAEPPDPSTAASSTTAVVTIASTTPTTTMEQVVASTLSVLPGEPPALDGSLDDSGWEAATITVVDDDLSLYWFHDDATLYLGVRHNRLGAVNLVVGEDDRVRVLHSSAALGSASYSRRTDGSWELEHGFDWCCRAGSDPTGADALLEAEGWSASIGTIGVAGQVEFRFEMGPGETWVALSWVGPTGEAIVWPFGLPADQKRALYGFRTENDVFVPESWTLIRLEG